MNLEILEEYIQQEWAPDFHYAHYEGIPWTPFLKTSDAACVALVTTRYATGQTLLVDGGLGLTL